MKKYLLVVLFLVILCISNGCSKTDYDINNIYGKYKYVECLYVSSNSSLDKASLTSSQKDIVRFVLEENKYFYYYDSNEALISMTNVSFKKTSLYENLNVTSDIKNIIKNTTRFDLYKNNTFQYYSFLFNDKHSYFVELRYTEEDSFLIWQIVEIKKY
jgi:hypothetical protein